MEEKKQTVGEEALEIINLIQERAKDSKWSSAALAAAACFFLSEVIAIHEKKGEDPDRMISLFFENVRGQYKYAKDERKKA